VALFIEVRVDAKTAADPELARKLAEVCPVDIFARAPDGRLEIVARNEDECTLCELCLAIGRPGAVEVRKLYDGGRLLERSA
jgi:NAD-dependent dihydropyrimidine dehydrogenase PreA subunit